MIRVKGDDIRIAGNGQEIREEISKLIMAISWKGILTAEDMILAMAKGILEAKTMEEDDDEEDSEE